MRIRTRILVELIRLTVALAIALVLAGELVRRVAYDEWLPGRLQSPMQYGLRTIVIADSHEFVAEFKADRVSRRIIPIGPMLELKSTRRSGWEPEPRIYSRSRLLRQSIPDGLAGSSHGQVGWPMAMAEYMTVGDPPGPFDPYAIEPGATAFTVSVGLAEIGFLGIATRPVFPGFLVLVASVYVVLLAGAGLRRLPRILRAKRHGFCRQCGYDLAGIEGKVCPECGMNSRPRTDKQG
jgi:ribosomal protein L37E